MGKNYVQNSVTSIMKFIHHCLFSEIKLCTSLYVLTEKNCFIIYTFDCLLVLLI